MVAGFAVSTLHGTMISGNGSFTSGAFGFADPGQLHCRARVDGNITIPVTIFGVMSVYQMSAHLDHKENLDQNRHLRRF